MKVKLEDVGACRKVMHVEVPNDMVASEYDSIVNAYAKAARIPGFRPGKAPTNVVENRYAKRITEEAKDRLVPRFCREALSQEGIVPLAIVDVRDVVLEREAGLMFKVTIDIAPKFKLPKYMKIVLKENKVEIEDKDVEDAIGRLVESFARFEDVTGRSVRQGDLVKIDYSGVCENRPVDDFASDCRGLGNGKDFWVLVGEPDFLPNFSAGLAGAAIDENREINVHFPDGYHVPAVAGKDAVYTVLVKGIREKILPEIDGEFLKKLDVESKQALHEKVCKELVEAAQKKEEDRLKNEIARFLLEKTEFDLPQSLVEQETGVMVRNIVQRIAMQGATKEQIKERRDEILNAATQSSTERVKLTYILNRIAEEEKIEVQDSEVDSRIESMAKRYGTSSERFRAELEKTGGVEKLKRDIGAEKTLSFLLTHAKIKK